MKTDKGGWIVFQKRTSSEVSFERDWNSYAKGFGDLLGNFWLGLDALHAITSGGGYTLRIDLQDLDGNFGYAKYLNFKIGSRAEKYKLTYDSYSSGTLGDSMAKSKGMAFSTPDQDNDMAAGGSCAKSYKSGWWFKDCYHANLNGLYRTKDAKPAYSGEKFSEYITWLKWKWQFGTIKTSNMMLKE